MIELIGLQGFDEAHVVDDLRKMGEAIGYPGSRSSVLLEWELVTQHIGSTLYEGEILALEKGLRAGLSIQSLEIRLVIE